MYQEGSFKGIHNMNPDELYSYCLQDNVTIMAYPSTENVELFLAFDTTETSVPIPLAQIMSMMLFHKAMINLTLTIHGEDVLVVDMDAVDDMESVRRSLLWQFSVRTEERKLKGHEIKHLEQCVTQYIRLREIIDLLDDQSIQEYPVQFNSTKDNPFI